MGLYCVEGMVPRVMLLVLLRVAGLPGAQQQTRQQQLLQRPLSGACQLRASGSSCMASGPALDVDADIS
jgi:hypothetical protein